MSQHSALTDTDTAYMQQALLLAEQGIGRCAPNPSVGCIIVKDNKIIAEARTANGGRPHAEAQALEQAGEAAKGATIYVTLEPCAHHGQTPPCAEAIIDAGITRVVIACTDPYPKVNGSGIELLKNANIEVITGICQAEAISAQRGFFSRVKRLRPWITLKTATSSDGFIAKPDGSSKWITGEQARENGHRLRARNDAILTGSGTYIYDSPKLTCRIAGLEDASPKRYLLDRRGRIENSDFTILRHNNLNEVVRHLANNGINYLMVEAGAKLSGAFLEAGLVDELYWYRAPKPLNEGIKAFAGAWDELNTKPEIIYETILGIDKLTVYRFTDYGTLFAQK